MLGTIMWDGLNQNTQRQLWRTLGEIGVRRQREGWRGAPEELWCGVAKLLDPKPMTLESEEERRALQDLLKEAMAPLKAQFRAGPSSGGTALVDVLSELIILQSLIRELPVAA